MQASDSPPIPPATTTSSPATVTPVPPAATPASVVPAPAPIPQQSDVSFAEIAGTLSGHHPLKQWISSLPPLPPGQSTASLLVSLAQGAQKLAAAYNEAVHESVPDITGYEVTSYFPYTKNGEQFVNTFVTIRTARNLSDGSIAPFTSENA